MLLCYLSPEDRPKASSNAWVDRFNFAALLLFLSSKSHYPKIETGCFSLECGCSWVHLHSKQSACYFASQYRCVSIHSPASLIPEGSIRRSHSPDTGDELRATDRRVVPKGDTARHLILRFIRDAVCLPVARRATKGMALSACLWR